MVTATNVTFLTRDMINKLNEAAIEWHPMLPIQPLKGRWRRLDPRNHRKILMVDGRVGFVGSLNMIDASYHNPKHERAAANGASWSCNWMGPWCYRYT